jgi:hypothetical protein
LEIKPNDNVNQTLLFEEELEEMCHTSQYPPLILLQKEDDYFSYIINSIPEYNLL